MDMSAKPQTRSLSVSIDELKIRLADRLPEFDRDQSLSDGMAEAWTLLDGHETDLAGSFWRHYNQSPHLERKLSAENLERAVENTAAYTRARLSAPTNQKWVEMLKKHAYRIVTIGTPLVTVLSAMTAVFSDAQKIMRDKAGEDVALFARVSDAFARLTMLESEVMISFITQLQEKMANKEREQQLELFREQIEAEVTAASTMSDALSKNAVTAAAATRGMLGQAAEVAAASEQSALAMREAAHTAAGLIRAIEEARAEVESSAKVANRAAEQAGYAVDVAASLSDHAKAIESIVSLIREIAGQTNLLALNATIEAARAGDAGRGFAVVAQEVKNLAAQTARATDDIAKQIASIQSATKQTVDANGTIRETVAEVQTAAGHIREAMDNQAHTVSSITSAVDETALAADSMSNLIAAIRRDTEEVAEKIDNLDGGVGQVNDRIRQLNISAAEFVAVMQG